MATTNAFAATPHIESNIATVAETGLTAPASAVLCFTAAAGGSRIHRIDIQQVAATAAGNIMNLFWYDGSNYRLWQSVKMDTVAAVSATAPPARATLLFPDGIPVPGTGLNRLYAATYSGDDAVVTVYGGDL